MLTIDTVNTHFKARYSAAWWRLRRQQDASRRQDAMSRYHADDDQAMNAVALSMLWVGLPQTEWS